MVEARPKATAASSVTKSPAATSTALKKTGAAVTSTTAAKVTPGASKPTAAAGSAAPKGAAASTNLSTRVKGAQRDDYECPICLRLCAQPVLTPCKHFMCFQCSKRVIGAGMTCPMCRAHFDKLFVPSVDKQLQRQIAAAMGHEYEERK